MRQINHHARQGICVSVVIIVFITAIAFTGCAPEERVMEYSVGKNEYLFQPQNPMNLNLIRQSLTPTEGVSPQTLLKPNSPPVTWTQNQFLDLIISFVSDEIQSDAKIESVFFAVSCHDVDSGPQVMDAIYYRMGNYQGKPARLQTWVIVDAQAGYLRKSLTAYTPPRPPDLHVENLSAKIPAEKILTMAEQSGGKQYRESKLNQCLIRGSLTENQWFITYATDSQEVRNTLNLYFDATTGTLVRVIKPSLIITLPPNKQ